MLKVLLIDDHPVTNAGLTACLEKTGRFTVTGRAATLTEAKRFIGGEGTSQEVSLSSLPSCIILDIQLGGDNGLDFLPFLDSYCKKHKTAKPPVLVCSVIEDPFRIKNAFDTGAAGYLPKSGNLEEIVTAIDTVLKGGTYLPERYKIILEENPGLFTLLTPRETEVLALFRQNLTNTQIAESLGLSEQTVKNHIANIYFKTKTGGREDLLKL
jgi:NarL family two-component system response regulator LiaR